jgi:hypothetical protein
MGKTKSIPVALHVYSYWSKPIQTKSLLALYSSFYFYFLATLVMSYTHYAQLVDSHHTEWQEHFNALLEHIKDPDDFDALILSDTDFEDQIKHVLSIKQPMLVQRAAIIRFLEGNLFTTTNLKEFMKDPIDFSAIFNIFLSAAQAGYLPDTVTLKGPSPGQTWTIITSPVKKVLQANKSHITKPILFQLPSSPTPTPTPTLSSPPYQPPILSTPYTLPPRLIPLSLMANQITSVHPWLPF